MNIASLGQGAQDLELARGQAGEPEQGEAGGEGGQRRVGREALAGAPAALGGAGHADAPVQPAPELGLPLGAGREGEPRRRRHPGPAAQAASIPGRCSA